LFLIETDVVLAVSSIGDLHHAEAVRLLEVFRGRLMLSPFTLVEGDLLVRSGRFKVKSLSNFHEALENLLDLYEVRVLAPRPRHHAVAEELRGRVPELTYFDSLHASVALVEGAELISYDTVYAHVAGLSRVHPRDALKRRRGAQ